MSDTIETSAEQVSEERNAIEEAMYALQCSRVWIMVAIEGPVDSNSEAVARTDLERANDAIRSLRELLSARTSTAPVAWLSPNVVNSLSVARSEGKAWQHVLSPVATAKFTVPVYASPPPPQPGVRVTEEQIDRIYRGLTSAGITLSIPGNVSPSAAMRAALTAIPDSGEGWRRAFEEADRELNVTDEELIRIRNMCEREGDVKIWARILSKLVTFARIIRSAHRSPTPE